MANLETQWGIKSLPVGGKGCTLCHVSDKGGAETATRPFGETMQDRGVKGARLDLLRQALEYVRVHATAAPIVDSDHDTVADYTEIAIDRTDPNDRKSFIVPTPPTGGSGAESGAGGEAGAGGHGEGGAANAAANGPAPYTPPSLDIPPPFEHGCALGAAGDSRPWGLASLALVLAGLVAARRRVRPR